MKNLSRRKKNNIIIASLCGVLVLMGIGYAAFASGLKINGTSSISSNFNVLITDITSGSIVGSASNASEPTHTDTTATFSTNLVSPGDSITYTIRVENRGNIDAVLTGIEVNTGNNDAIEFITSGIEEGDVLLKETTDELKVKVTYSNSVTGQPSNTTSTITVTLNYEQAGVGEDGTVLPTETVSLGGQNVETVTYGDGLYKDEYEDERYLYKGANPNNYIKFENGEIWRIIAKESDGTYKVVKNTLLADQTFDNPGFRISGYCSQGAAPTYGCNAWAEINYFNNGTYSGIVDKKSKLNTYLNGEYYSNLDFSIQKYITLHQWNIGTISSDNVKNILAEEKLYNWSGNIGIVTVSEFLMANSNDDQCDSHSKILSNYELCEITN